jgi:RNA polymerase sigma factor (sigma-70 family)
VGSFIGRRVPDPNVAEELLQEVFFALWQSMIRSLEIRSIKQWVFRVARNKIADYYRRECGDRRAQVEAQSTAALSPVSSDPASLVMDGLEAAALVASLGPAHRQLYELIANFELTYNEAGQLLHIPGGTVRSRIHTMRARALDGSNTGTRSSQPSGGGKPLAARRPFATSLPPGVSHPSTESGLSRSATTRA